MSETEVRPLALVLTSLLFAQAALAQGSQVSEDGGPEFQQWSQRLAIAAKQHDAAEELLCVMTIAHRWPWALKPLSRWVEQALSDSEHAQPVEPRLELLQVLYARRWRLSNGEEPSRWWRQLSLALLERNDAQQAFEVAAHITDPYSLIAMQADNRYKRIAKSQFVERDVPKAAQNEVASRRTASEEAPRDLSRTVGLVYALMRLHRYDEVLRLSDIVIQRQQSAAPATTPYDDLPQQFPWLLDVRAHAFMALARYDEALALFRRACEESTQNHVGHCLNLASNLAKLDRPREALAAMPPLNDASPGQRAFAAQVRVMAASELDDSAALAAALEDLPTQTANYPGNREWALVVAGRQDEAATVLLSRLSDPELRTDALLELQDFADHPAPPRETQWRGQIVALRNRSDARQAIAASGRIANYPLAGIIF